MLAVRVILYKNLIMFFLDFIDLFKKESFCKIEWYSYFSSRKFTIELLKNSIVVINKTASIDSFHGIETNEEFSFNNSNRVFEKLESISKVL